MSRSRTERFALVGLFGLALANVGVAFFVAEFSFLLGATVLCTAMLLSAMFFDLQIPDSNFMRKPSYTVIFILILEIFVAASVTLMRLITIGTPWVLVAALTVTAFDVGVVVGLILWDLKLGFARAPNVAKHSASISPG